MADAINRVFIDCRFNASLAVDAFSSGGDNYATQQLTTLTETIATSLSLVICASFFLVYGLVRDHGAAATGGHSGAAAGSPPPECCASCRGRLRRVYAWDRSTDHYLCIAALAAFQGLVYFMSASGDPPFQPLTLNNQTCRAQSIMFQFASSGLNAAVIAEMVDMYLVLVKSVPVTRIRKVYTPWLLAFVFFVALVFTVVPLILEATMGVEIFTANNIAGFCWLNTQCSTVMYGTFFNSQEIATFVVTTCLSVAIVARLCRIYKHLRANAKLPFWLYIVRRLLFASLVFLEHVFDTAFFLNDRIHPGTSPEALHQLISFGIHCPAIIYLFAFMVPDALFIYCLATTRKKLFKTSLLNNHRGGNVVRAGESTDARVPDLHSDRTSYGSGSSSCSDDDLDVDIDDEQVSPHVRAMAQLRKSGYAVRVDRVPVDGAAMAAAKRVGQSSDESSDGDDGGSYGLEHHETDM